MYTVGFIGLGHMGYPMALNLLNSKLVDNLYVYDLVDEPMQKLVSKGAKKAANSTEIAQACDVIITMLQTGVQVKKTCLSNNGLFEHSKPGTLYIDCSTIDVKSSRELHKEAKLRGINMLDAPVSGGVKGAQAATLTVMVGGDKKILDKANSLLSIVGKNVIHAGGPGNGQVAKVCNNMVLGISMIAVSEAFTLAEKLGLDAKNFFDIATKGSAECWSLTKYCPSPNILPDVPSSNDYMPGFSAAMMLKDLLLSQEAANSVNCVTPLGANASSIYSLFVNNNHADEDFSAIIKFLDNHYK